MGLVEKEKVLVLQSWPLDDLDRVDINGFGFGQLRLV
jgi:hypothetical protein